MKLLVTVLLVAAGLIANAGALPAKVQVDVQVDNGKSNTGSVSSESFSESKPGPRAVSNRYGHYQVLKCVATFSK